VAELVVAVPLLMLLILLIVHAQVISQVGSSVLTGPQVLVTMTAADVTVKVTGTAERVVPFPGLSFSDTATVAGPVERFVPVTAQG
jgi:hypothetical protein